MSGLWQTVSFIMRTLGARNQQSIHFVIWGQLPFLLAPLCRFFSNQAAAWQATWFPDMITNDIISGVNAFAFMTVARMIYFGLPEKEIWGIKAIRLTTLFVMCDIFCFMVQGTGAGMFSNPKKPEKVTAGRYIYMGGMAFQLVILVIFIALTVTFTRQMIKVTSDHLGRMRILIATMMIVLLMILVSVFQHLLMRVRKS